VRGELPADPERIFAAALVDRNADPAVEAAAYRPAYGHLALLVQLPGVDVGERAAAEKGGALTEHELRILDERTRSVRAWLETYAPAEARVAIQRDGVPEAVGSLTDDQRRYCAALGEALTALSPSEWAGERVQSVIFATAKAREIATGAAFAALYAAFLGRSSGPRAGWLLASLDQPFVVERLAQAGAPA
jgi:lysyl-tRNA synthetase class 1